MSEPPVSLATEEKDIAGKTRIGIIGGGQLGLMACEAGKEIGFAELTVLDPTSQCPASSVAEQIIGDLKDPTSLRKLANHSDILTYEIEHINTDALMEMEHEGVHISPSPETLAIIQDKYLQKEFLTKHGIPVAPFQSVSSPKDIENAAGEFGYPLVLKAKKDAYDGRGNVRINSPSDIEYVFAKLQGRELYVEECIKLDKEIGLMVARNSHGNIVTHPVVQMIHERDICQVVLAPAPIDVSLRDEAQDIARETMEHLEGAGIFGIEMFLDVDGKIWLNEIAPRPHNLGHYTIEACKTSQFSQHLRAITNLSLGPTEMLYPAAVMINILGTRNGPAEVHGLEGIDERDTFVHIYGKRETKIDRKMGHITVVGSELGSVYKKAMEARAALSI